MHIYSSYWCATSLSTTTHVHCSVLNLPHIVEVCSPYCRKAMSRKTPTSLGSTGNLNPRIIERLKDLNSKCRINAEHCILFHNNSVLKCKAWDILLLWFHLCVCVHAFSGCLWVWLAPEPVLAWWWRELLQSKLPAFTVRVLSNLCNFSELNLTPRLWFLYFCVKCVHLCNASKMTLVVVMYDYIFVSTFLISA